MMTVSSASPFDVLHHIPTVSLSLFPSLSALSAIHAHIYISAFFLMLSESERRDAVLPA